MTSLGVANAALRVSRSQNGSRLSSHRNAENQIQGTSELKATRFEPERLLARNQPRVQQRRRFEATNRFTTANRY